MMEGLFRRALLKPIILEVLTWWARDPLILEVLTWWARDETLFTSRELMTSGQPVIVSN